MYRYRDIMDLWRMLIMMGYVNQQQIMVCVNKPYYSNYNFLLGYVLSFCCSFPMLVPSVQWHRRTFFGARGGANCIIALALDESYVACLLDVRNRP